MSKYLGPDIPVGSVYPSDEISIWAHPDEEYGGAHTYYFSNSEGFSDGKAKYVYEKQRIDFVKKEADGTMTPGLQSEQLLKALIDRHKKLNAKYPSREGALAITNMEQALHWLRARVEERMERNVMGKLEK